MLGNSAVAVVVVVVVVRTRPRVIPLAMITMRKSTHGFPFLSHMSMGLRLAALRAAGVPLLLLHYMISEEAHERQLLIKSFFFKRIQSRKNSNPTLLVPNMDSGER